MMRKSKDVYITFYQNISGILYVSNGYSFGREEACGYTDIFIDKDGPRDKIKEQLDSIPHPVKRIFVSVSYIEELYLILPFVSDNWIIGGNIFSENGLGNKENTNSDSLTKKIKGATIVNISLEKILNGTNTPMSNTFDYYFDSLLAKTKTKNIYYNCSLGRGCYYGKCTFCSYSLCNKENYVRDNVQKILKEIPKNIYGGFSQVHTSLSSVPPNILKEILYHSWDETVVPVLFIRPDENIIQLLESINPDLKLCSNKRFCVGVEILSDTALKLLQKGTTVSRITKLISLLLKNGGIIELEIMSNYPFLNSDIEREVKEACTRIKKLVAFNDVLKSHIWFYDNGDVLWHKEETIKKYTDDYIKVTNSSKLGDEVMLMPINTGFYKPVIREGSAVDKYNKMIKQYIKETGIVIK